uniref:non-specific serine/threonine protein kinase n=1 Tax=Anolis carolinensis TaxID=28377 RepID=H9GSC0_ANOCA
FLGAEGRDTLLFQGEGREINPSSEELRFVEQLVRKLLIIISRPARLLECLEFDPEEFYHLLEAAEGQAKVGQGIKTDIPRYIIGQLGLAKDPLKGELSRLGRIKTTTFSLFLCPPPKKKQSCALVSRRKPFAASSSSPQEKTWVRKCGEVQLIDGWPGQHYDWGIAVKPVGFTDERRLHQSSYIAHLFGVNPGEGLLPSHVSPFLLSLLITSMGHIKLTDFGLSKIGLMNLTTNLYEGHIEKDTREFVDKQVCGTPEYIAPEVILIQGYGKPVDWWAMGIILYEFLVGCVPFFGDTPEELFGQVISDEIIWPEGDESLPPDAQDLIMQLLRHCPLERLGTGGAHEVKQHPFFRNLDWTGLLRQKAEFIPQLEAEDDTSYFDTRSDRYRHLGSEDEETNDEESCVEIRHFSSCSHRFSKVYSSSEFLANPPALNISSSSSGDQGRADDKEDQAERWDRGSGDEEKSRHSATETRLRAWTSCGSTVHAFRQECAHRGPGPLSATCSLEAMPRFAFSSEDESPSRAPAKRERPVFVVGDPEGPPLSLKGPGKPSALAADLVSLNRVRLRSNSTGAKHSTPRASEGESGRRAVASKESPAKHQHQQRLASGGRVPKSASVSALSLIISTDDFGGGALVSPISPRSLSSNPSSRDSSPSRDPLLGGAGSRPPIVIHSQGKKYGFTLRAIRVYMGDSDIYAVHHMVWSVEEGSPAQEAGLRAGDLITHVNGESVLGLVHMDVVELLLKSGNKVALRTTALENTSIKVGPARKNSSKTRMARRSKKGRKRDGQDRRKSLFRKISRQPSSSSSAAAAASASVLHTSRSYSSGLHHSLSSGESLPGSPTHSLSPGPTPPCRSPAPDAHPDASSSPQSTSPVSSTPSSPAGHIRPSSLHGLGPKLSGQRYKVGRRKSTSSIPPSPLACTPSSSSSVAPHPPSPQRSPSPLPFPKAPPTFQDAVESPEGGSRLRDWSGGGFGADHQEVVVMRRLNLSERRDSFKKQEAVQEVSFDEPEAAGGEPPAEKRTPTRRPGLHAAPWVAERPGHTPVPHIAVQGADPPASAAPWDCQADPPASSASWECQASYPLRLEARVYIEQADGSTAVEYTSVSSSQRRESLPEPQVDPRIGHKEEEPPADDSEPLP